MDKTNLDGLLALLGEVGCPTEAGVHPELLGEIARVDFARHLWLVQTLQLAVRNAGLHGAVSTGRLRDREVIVVELARREKPRLLTLAFYLDQP